MLKKKCKILVALSGGVDSSVAAALLKDQGYDLVGVFLKFWKPIDKNNNLRFENNCCEYNALNNARLICKKLQIPFYVLNVSREFKKYIVDDFVSKYENGYTPNPCVVCNKKIKFGWLIEKGKKLDCQFVATGHYANIKKISYKGETKYELIESKDKNKDQSYFLWQLDQDQLRHVLFPIGNFTKLQVRKIAKKYGFPNFDKKESQDICFVNNNLVDFLKYYSKNKQKIGNIVDKKGNIMAQHRGLIAYTVGQRERLPQLNYKNYYKKINPQLVPPFYVLKLDSKKNELIVGQKEDLYGREIVLENIKWINQIDKKNKEVYAKIRYNSSKIKCIIFYQDKIKIVFAKKVLIPAKGQSVVFYKKNKVLGGGIIK